MLAVVFSLCLLPAFADHLKGGFFTYEYLGPGTSNPSNLRYHIKLTVYMVCNPNSGQLTNPIPITIFDASTFQMYSNEYFSITQQYRLDNTTADQCITGDQSVCYYIVIYEKDIEVANNTQGYTVSYQRCCRIINIQNLPAPSSTFGNTYSINIPGSSAPLNAQHNNSPQFLINDTAVVCGGNYFEVPFKATDPDADSLSYSFCAAWTAGGQVNSPPNNPNSPTPDPAAPPPYSTVPYSNGFNGSAPL